MTRVNVINLSLWRTDELQLTIVNCLIKVRRAWQNGREWRAAETERNCVPLTATASFIHRAHRVYNALIHNKIWICSFLLFSLCVGRSCQLRQAPIRWRWSENRDCLYICLEFLDSIQLSKLVLNHWNYQLLRSPPGYCRFRVCKMFLFTSVDNCSKIHRKADLFWHWWIWDACAGELGKQYIGVVTLIHLYYIIYLQWTGKATLRKQIIVNKDAEWLGTLLSSQNSGFGMTLHRFIQKMFTLYFSLFNMHHRVV